MDYFLKKQKDIRKKNSFAGFERYKGSAIEHNSINYIFVIYIFEKI